MKMPSTYISLLLLCGLMFVYNATQKHIHALQKPALSRPMVKDERPLVKKFSRDKPITVPLDQNNSDENVPRQTGLTRKNFSFFGDRICQIAPVLKNAK